MAREERKLEWNRRRCGPFMVDRCHRPLLHLINLMAPAAAAALCRRIVLSSWRQHTRRGRGLQVHAAAAARSMQLISGTTGVGTRVDGATRSNARRAAADPTRPCRLTSVLTPRGTGRVGSQHGTPPVASSGSQLGSHVHTGNDVEATTCNFRFRGRRRVFTQWALWCTGSRSRRPGLDQTIFGSGHVT